MEENKNLENEIMEETAEEVTEEVTEVAEETAEVIEEAIDEVAEVVEEEVDETVETVEPVEEMPKKGSKTGAIIVVLVAAIIIVLAVVTSTMDFNKYNKLGYVDISGKTVQDIADAEGITLAEFLEQYKLPSDMPGNTTEAAAYYSIPTGVIAEMNGLTFDTLKTMFKIPDTVTEETLWGEAEGSIRLADYIGGEEKLDAFKQKYGFGDEVTADTPWGELRNTVDLVTKAEREAQEAAQQAAQEEAEKADTEELEVEEVETVEE